MLEVLHTEISLFRLPTMKRWDNHHYSTLNNMLPICVLKVNHQYDNHPHPLQMVHL